MIEDASEDFSNIEEHISSFQKINGETPYKNNNTDKVTGMNLKD